MSTRPAGGAAPSETKWEQIDQLLAAVAELSRSQLSPAAFARQVLTRLLEALPGVAAGFWSVDIDQRIALTATVQRDGSLCPEPLLDQARRLKVVRDVAARKAALVAEVQFPNTLPDSLSDTRHPFACGAILVCPVQDDLNCVGFLELIQSDDGLAIDRQWSLDVLGSIAELYADYYRRRRLEWLTERELLWRRLRAFSLEIHRSLGLNETAYAIVNDGRSLIDCDRLTLLACDAGSCQMLAVSGAVACDPRSDAVTVLKSLAIATSAQGLPFVFPPVETGIPSESGNWQVPADSDDPQAASRGASPFAKDAFGAQAGLPPELHQPLLAFLDSSGAKSLAAIPLIPKGTDPENSRPGPQAAAGVLVIEQFSRAIDSPMCERLQLVGEHCAPALQNARRYQSAPWTALFGEERWRRLTRGRSRLRLWLYVAAAIFVLSWIVPAQFEIEARGELQPRLRRELFAADDAVVEELKVDHDDRVDAGQVLAVLRNPQLDLEFKRVSGELQTTRERLAAVQAARVELAIESAARPGGAARLSGEEAGLRAMLASLERQSKLLDEQQAALVLRSPIAGRVLTWDLPQLLQSRPVQRGQVLMTVADPDGPWVVELHVPERQIGHLIDARRGGEAKLPVTYVLATDPARKHRAEVDSVAASVELDRGNEPSVLVTVGVNRGELENPRPGAGTTGKVYCGWRPLAYVWLHDLFDAVWSWVWF